MLLDIAVATQVAQEMADLGDIANSTIKHGPQHGPPVAAVWVLYCHVVVLYLLTDI